MLYFYIGIGGFLGAIARYGAGNLVNSFNNNTFPWATFLVNLLGSFILAFVLTVVVEHPTVSPELRLGVTTGFLGAFTTFSTLMLEILTLADLGLLFTAILYLMLSLVLGLGSAWLGVLAARRLTVLEK